MVNFSKNKSCEGSDKGKTKKNRKQRYLPKGILFISDVQELFEYLTIIGVSVLGDVFSEIKHCEWFEFGGMQVQTE